MSDYFGNDTLEDWLEEELGLPPTPNVVALFERWRSQIESSIRAWWDTDRGEGPRSWRGWGRGYPVLSSDQELIFEEAIRLARQLSELE